MQQACWREVATQTLRTTDIITLQEKSVIAKSQMAKEQKNILGKQTTQPRKAVRSNAFYNIERKKEMCLLPLKENK
jgi:hypothetical protein